MTPPTPVLAPPNGSTADGWLWVSALRAIVVPVGERDDAGVADERRPHERRGDGVGGVAQQAEQRLHRSPSVVVMRGPERLVGAVLAPRLGERLELDVGRVAAGGAEVVADDGQLLGVEGERPLDAERGERRRRRGRARRSTSTAGRVVGAGVQVGVGACRSSSAR